MKKHISPSLSTIISGKAKQVVIHSILTLLVVCGNSLVLAQTEEPDESIRFSGFLGDYSKLEPHPDHENMLLYRKMEGALQPYTKFLIEPVIFYFHPDAIGKGVDPEDLKRLADYFRNEVVKELGKSDRYEVVDEPGPGVLRIRAAITDVVPVGKTGNVALKSVGVAASQAVAPGVGLLVPRLNIGEASIEVEMLDSTSEERLVALVDKKRGRRFFSFFRGLRTWGDVEAAFRSWSEEFRKVLDRLNEM